MKANGRHLLRFSGFLEIIFGVVSILMTLWILNQDAVVNFFGAEMAKDALWVLVYIYGVAGFKILTGLFGMIFANKVKHAKACYFFGIILILLQATAFGTIEFNTINIISYAVAMLVPILYLYGAVKNRREQIKES